MNEINSPIPSQASNLTLDKPALKLLVAQIYQAQLQQLSNGGFFVQLPTKQGPLQIPLPTSFTGLTPVNSDNKSQAQKLPVQVEFISQNNGQLTLNIKAPATTINLPINPVQAQQIALALSPSLLNQAGPKDSQLNTNAIASLQISNVLVNASNQTTGAVINASISINNNKIILNIAKLPSIILSSASSRAIGAAIQRQVATYSKEMPVQLIIRPANSQLHLMPTVTQQGQANAVSPPISQQLSTMTAEQLVKVDLNPQEHIKIQQLLRNLVNQQTPTVTVNNQQLSYGKLALLTLPNQPSQAGATVFNNANYQVQITPKGNQWQLQLSNLPLSDSASVATDKLNLAVQLITKPATPSSASAAPISTTVMSAQSLQQSVQQAWRQLLPLLPQHIDPLADNALEPEMSKVLSLVRQGQPDGNKVLTTNQLTQQLSALLQFQPLQATPNPQTGAGTLALAIQLLLGNLQQKATAPASNTSPNQRLASLIGQLEPAQASGLLRQLSSHSSVIQQSQLNMVDPNSNQQLVLQLPMQQGQQSVLNQISIEQREANNKEAGSKQKQWRLTMKFDLQKLGKLLVIATLQQDELQLQFYAEQVAAQKVTERFLPLLKERCQAQGIEVNQAECVLGVIPQSLMPRTNSLVTIRV